MINQKYSDMFQITKLFPILKHVNIYDRQSFIRAYVLDNGFVCIIAYILFYVALWYANKVMQRVEETNQKMQLILEKNRSKLEDVAALKNKRSEFEDVVVKVKEAQKIIKQQLDVDIKKVNDELTLTVNKLSDLEKIVNKWKLWKSNFKPLNGDMKTQDDNCSKEIEISKQSDSEFIKVLEPSFEPTALPEPPPRKYGTFARRPPGRRPASFSKPQVSTTLTSQPIEF
ncbi:uncharacterized protein LOC127288079 [Leptopilina boulardi]|uniref:uncharacterized protein LOC127288079 n=1 Tax=Leptopilina boulardi TaxID=63433 RepID=UPI0021F59438|nr:uncharacterized protein LOC127288079 [Leptopilina boulardi]